MFNRRAIAGLWLLLILIATSRAEALDFVPGHYYASSGSIPGTPVLSHFDPNGVFVESLTLSPSLGYEMRGIAFGPDGLLYAAFRDSLYGGSLVVHAINSAGIPQATYTTTYNVSSNTGLGKIAFGPDGHFYAGAAFAVVKFAVGDTDSGTSIYMPPGYCHDLKVLPNGNLLSATNYDIQEITPSGTLVRTIDIDHHLADIRSIEYHAPTDTLFAFHLGYTNHYSELMRINATTGTMLEAVNAPSSDLWLATDGKLVAFPGIFDQSLNPLGQFTGGYAVFVTQLVPEPSAASATLLVALTLIRLRRPAC